MTDIFKEINITEEEFQQARKLIEQAPWFSSWRDCPFGGWSYIIRDTVLSIRENNPTVNYPIAITYAGK